MVNARSAPLWRLFVAVWPDASARDALAAWQRAWTWPAGAALVPSERLHLTLHFLGNVPVDEVPAVTAALRVPFEPFELHFGHAELWPGGTAVVRPDAMPPALPGLHSLLAAALAGLDRPVESRRYKAHVTLARRAIGATPPAAQPNFSWRADGFVLVRSLPDPGGYELLARFS
ncbi:MAG TPA: RNA 2',3'-cyclic phosphodiesterase [Ramlibacter sp.]